MGKFCGQLPNAISTLESIEDFNCLICVYYDEDIAHVNSIALEVRGTFGCSAKSSETCSTKAADSDIRPEL